MCPMCFSLSETDVLGHMHVVWLARPAVCLSGRVSIRVHYTAIPLG